MESVIAGDQRKDLKRVEKALFLLSALFFLFAAFNFAKNHVDVSREVVEQPQLQPQEKPMSVAEIEDLTLKLRQLKKKLDKTSSER
jgi:hypothetical protein